MVCLITYCVNLSVNHTALHGWPAGHTQRLELTASHEMLQRNCRFVSWLQWKDQWKGCSRQPDTGSPRYLEIKSRSGGRRARTGFTQHVKQGVELSHHWGGNGKTARFPRIPASRIPASLVCGSVFVPPGGAGGMRHVHSILVLLAVGSWEGLRTIKH